jgi:hypothetical protein
MKIKVLLLVIFCLSLTNAIAQKYEKSVEVGGSIGIGDINNNYLDILMINGCRLSNTFYLGVGTGFSYGNLIEKFSEIESNFTNRVAELSIPLFARLKIDLHKKNKLTPFIAGNFGYVFYPNEIYDPRNGIMIEPDYGIEYKLYDYLTLYGILGLHMRHAFYYNEINEWDHQEVSTIVCGITIRGGIKF